jgi:pyridoxal phosphate enzyme (YggS family)
LLLKGYRYFQLLRYNSNLILKCPIYLIKWAIVIIYMVLKTGSTILKRISHAAMRAGRAPDEIRLIAVTKTVSIERIREAVEAGLRIFGENRVQEAIPKIAFFRGHGTVKWHLIGHLQKNKAKKAVEIFDVIESVDSRELAERINRCAGEAGKIQPVFIQVKLGDEETKHGIPAEEVEDLVGDVSQMENIRVEGLMAVPPYHENPEEVRPYFRKLRRIRDDLVTKGFPVRGLSMGMSHDFEVAIEEGATEVRIGTEIFGRR